jgi:hypothetical protein
MHIGTPLRDMPFKSPQAAIFFNHDARTLIVASCDTIFIVDLSTRSKQQFRRTPKGSYYRSHAVALSEDDAVLVTGCYNRPYSVCGFDTASCQRMWIHNTDDDVSAVCMLRAYVLVTVACSPTLVLDRNTGAQIATLQKADGWLFGLGVIEGLCFNSFVLLMSSDLNTSVYLAFLQHLLHKQAEPLRLPLEMWHWIAKNRV